MPRPIHVLAALLCALAAACHKDEPDRAAYHGGPPQPPATAERQMVSAANPYAAEAGLAILRIGGSAVDAAIAMELVLTLVEPQSSGVGGGAFLLHYTAAEQRVDAYDGRETAPAAIAADVFRNEDGSPKTFFDAVVGGDSVGVPGFLRMAELAHKDHGRLPWGALFQPAIRLAEDGFTISPRYHALVDDDPYLKIFPNSAAYFYDADGTPLPIGARRDNPALAETYRIVAERGADAFYTGPIAESIAAAVGGAPRNPGALTVADLAAYEAKRRDTICRPYRAWTVCTMPPPTSGGVALLQILGMLESYDLAELGPAKSISWHLLAEASRLAFADRDRYLGDPDFVDVPLDGLLARNYLRGRAGLIDPQRAHGVRPAGTPDGADVSLGPGRALERPSTTHLAVVDRDGNAVSMTASIEAAFGSRLMSGGFLLNNQLTDFSFLPEADGALVANRVEPGKRPRSSMSPLIALDEQGDFVMAIGSPGGSRIIGYVAKATVAALDWGLDMNAAIALANVVNRNGETEVEEIEAADQLADALAEYGHEISRVRLTSGLHGILVTEDGLTGGADPRREGVALGD